MERTELVFIPAPGLVGHLKPIVKFAQLLIDRNDHLSIKFLIMKLPSDSTIDNYIESIASSSLSQQIHFIHLPHQELMLESNSSFLYLFVENHKSYVKETIAKLIQPDSTSSPTRLAGIVVDMFCFTMIDVAKEFDIPSYVFFTFGAGFLGLMLHCASLVDNQNKDFISVLEGSETELMVPCFACPVPAKVLPPTALDTEFGLNMARRLIEAKSIIVNTFEELEFYALNSLVNEATPPIYPVGPILELEGGVGSSDETNVQNSDIINWLDQQPPSSVVYLCFGSKGYFNKDQVKEIACGLESSGFRFIWSLRLVPTKDGQVTLPGEHTHLYQVLPDGFLERTAGTGLVVEEITLDYRRDFDKSNVDTVTAEEIERGIRRVMEENSTTRRKVKMMREKCREAVMEGGSSYSSFDRLIKDIINHSNQGSQ
ncbi:UDP-glucuronosyl/UDP-glucosyltransferase [Corchorus olitorius]|uniref:UDP-glucuronosyl/UDP-glucosyltransferase n=1 Tax=Corchorus olitorius TaxID=93759 RepID=A0A1R3J2L2_9ROSI|nr:UDP-glucuronosyl/UDP-glucosyltransferase [Corchorus olitorius]